MDEKIKQLLRELGVAINESISSSEEVNRHIQRIRDEGYNLYVVLDATIGLNKEGEKDQDIDMESMATVSSVDEKEITFRINATDLAIFRSLGIDPTRKTRGARRIEPLARNRG